MLSKYSSCLLDQTNFYKVFNKDIKKTRKLLLIESPFLTTKRVTALLPIFNILIDNGIRIIVNTKPFEEHGPLLQIQATIAIERLQSLGIEVYMTIGHHRKLAVIDDDILYEGSLNILSYNDSCEIMRRIKSSEHVIGMLKFIRFKKWWFLSSDRLFTYMRVVYDMLTYHSLLSSVITRGYRLVKLVFFCIA